MDAQQLLKEGRLGAAIEQIGAELRSDPTNQATRTFLFEMLLFSGEYDRADKQLELLASAGREARNAGLLYRAALQAERTREDLFEGRLEGRDKPVAADSPAPAKLKGTFNGRPFETIADADARIGAQLEVVASFHYMWVPFEQIEAIEMVAPRRLRDLFWAPATVKTTARYQGNSLGEVLIPALSPLTWQFPDEQVQLGRLLEWARDEEGQEAPYGPKMLLIDGEETPLLDIRELVFTPSESTDQ